jgi:phosphate transport system permease protein
VQAKDVDMTQETGKRRKSVRRSVLIADWIADHVIKIGGVLVIATVLAILVFLVYQVMPLFKAGAVEAVYRVAPSPAIKNAFTAVLDEYKTIAVTTARDGSVTAFHARTGALLQADSFDLGGRTGTATARALDRKRLAFGFADGSVRLAAFHMDSEILSAKDVPEHLTRIDPRDRTDGRSVYSRIPGNQVRKITVRTILGESLSASPTGSPIVAIGYRGGPDRKEKTIIAADANGAVTLNRVTSRKNLLTGKMTEKVEQAPLPRAPSQGEIAYALITDRGDQAYLAEKSGRVHRYDLESAETPILAETADLLPKGALLTAFGFLLGERSIVVGGSDGSLNIWFRLRREHTGAPDGFGLVLTRELEPHPASVIGIEPGQRGRTFVTVDAQGNVWTRNATSELTLFRLKSATTGPANILAAAFAPRGDGAVVILADGTAELWDFRVPHPETSLSVLFGKVWYEGYPEPSYTWQSSGATDDVEPKLSLAPLIFGTLKATTYSLLFAVPVALLAAIYTSEFVHRSVRGTVKPIMEMMASLPSVILGFVAALVLAPVVEAHIAAVVLNFVVVPFSLVLAAQLWQMLPSTWAIRLGGIPKLLAMGSVVVAACLGCYELGPAFERVFFAGNFKVWVNGGAGSATPFLFMLLAPLAVLVTAKVFSKSVNPRVEAFRRALPPFGSALVGLVRWVALVIVSAAGAYAAAWLLASLGVDARDGFVGTYVQRNTLVVGFAMGFAVIPIIYTLAEDALNAVPDHLRSASLACGATPWQTAIWVVLPIAAGGVFSAIMIGMGRAVGETMIVVMAAGNTPLIDMNVFNGLRALSANLAVELPEAVKDGSLYRVLFLTALVLFLMTFAINSVAEVVRLRFRKRARQL